MDRFELWMGMVALCLGGGYVVGRWVGARTMANHAVSEMWRVFYRAHDSIRSTALQLGTRQFEAIMRGEEDTKAHRAEWEQYRESRSGKAIADLPDVTLPAGWFKWHDETVAVSLQEEFGRRGRAFITKDGELGCTRSEFGGMPIDVAIWLLQEWARWKEGLHDDD
jgi:hypothetical protein